MLSSLAYAIFSSRYRYLIWYMILGSFLFILSSCKDSGTDPKPPRPLIDQLNDIPGLEVTLLPAAEGFFQSLELALDQPVDHSNPEGQRFNQRMYLHHRDLDAPMVFLPSGYVSRPDYFSHLTSILEANQLQVTHRYMGDARPEPADWQYLTIEQAATDHHRIAEIFKNIYRGAWVSHGRSKNGMAALFHKRFYPEDVQATVAAVAPIIHGINDPRFETFLEEVGTEECRERIKTYQRLLLENRDVILPMIQDYMTRSGLNYQVEPVIILEYEVCEYPFSFWQFQNWDCADIPGEEATVEELYNHLEGAGWFRVYSQEYMDFYSPVYYQAYTELGWYRLINDHLEGLLVSDPEPSYSFFAPKNIPLEFQPEVMQDIEQWLQTAGNNIIYIYGGLDPWTAGAIELSGVTNAVKIVQEVADHGAGIETLDDPEAVYGLLEVWLGQEIP